MMDYLSIAQLGYCRLILQLNIKNRRQVASDSKSGTLTTRPLSPAKKHELLRIMEDHLMLGDYSCLSIIFRTNILIDSRFIGVREPQSNRCRNATNCCNMHKGTRKMLQLTGRDTLFVSFHITKFKPANESEGFSSRRKRSTLMMG
jgi:hypothetical protein